MKSTLKKSSVVILYMAGTEKALFLLRREGWCLPGGKQDSGESMKKCAQRETLEETGILVALDDLVYVGKSVSVSGRIVQVYFAGTNCKPSDVKISSEHSDWKWVEWEEIKNIELAGNTGKFLELLKPY